MELEVLENLLRWLEQKQNLKKLSPKSEMLCVIEMELVKNQMISTGNKLLHTPLGTEPLLQTPQYVISPPALHFSVGCRPLPDDITVCLFPVLRGPKSCSSLSKIWL